MEMFLFPPTNSRKDIAEDVGYLLHDCDGFVVKDFARDSLKMKWMPVSKIPEVDTGMLPFKTADSSGMCKIDVLNEMKFTNVLNEYEHLKLIVRHDVTFGEGEKNVCKNETENAAEESKTWTRAISLVHVCLRYSSALSNFEWKG